MTKLTRKVLLTKTSAGALAVGALSVAPGMAAAATRPETVTRPGEAGADLSGALAALKTAEPFVVYVSNPQAGEMVLMVGDQEIAVRDHALAARLWQARRAMSNRPAKSGVR